MPTINCHTGTNSPKMSEVVNILRQHKRDKAALVNCLNNLNNTEKEVLVKGIVQLVDNIENLHMRLFDNSETDQKTIEEEMRDISNFDQRELIKLRNWSIKFMTVVLVVTFVGFFGVVYFIDDQKASIINFFNDILNIFKVMF